jgi:hypothetical protein
MINQETSGGDEPIKGGTSTKVDKTPLYEANNTYLKDKRNLYNQRLTEFVTDAFRFSNTLPKVAGKSIASLDELPTLIEKYGTQLYDQAKTIKNNPDINDDQAKLLLTRQKKVDDAFGYVAQANKIIYEDLSNAAKHMDGKMAVKGWHTLLLSDNGQFKGPTQAKKDIDAYKAKMINQEMEAWRKANPAPQIAPTSWQRTDMPNPMANSFYKGPDGKVERLDSRPKIQNSKEGNMMLEAMEFEKVTNKYKNLNYDHALKRVLEEYNKNGKTRKIKAAEEGVFNENAGGAKTAMTKQEFRFDVDNFTTIDDQGNESVSEEMTYTVDLLKNVMDNPKVFFAKGAIGVDGKLPSGSDVKSKELVKALYEDLQTTLYNVDRRKGSNKRPAGSITFSPVAGGDENFHAYNIKLPSSYFDNYIGSKENPGIMRDQKDIISNGVTIYVPVEESKKIKIGQQSIKGTTISAVEGMIGLSADNSFSRQIDDAMDYKISLDKKTGQYQVTGNAVAYNPGTGKMDTIPLNKLGIKSNWDMTVDLDQLDKDLFKIGLKNYQLNRENKRENSRINGVRDPKKLSGN